ncbi:MAG: hypothetical protein JWL57_2153, partial [Actinobacteria bacterium]|nr:hypothetical protein [Actinomycetota bacterium]
AGVQLPGSGQGSVHFMFMGQFAGSTAPGTDGVGLATWTGGSGARGKTPDTRGWGVTTVAGGDGAGVTGWVADGVAAAGIVGAGVVGEGLVTRSLTDGLDGLPRARAAAVMPPAARTITASRTAHWGLVSLRSLVIGCPPSPPRIVGVADLFYQGESFPTRAAKAYWP